MQKNLINELANYFDLFESVFKTELFQSHMNWHSGKNTDQLLMPDDKSINCLSVSDHGKPFPVAP